jgi:hypothetical protein
MSDTTRAVLLLADISGFTKFLKLHTLSTSHARQIIVRLLDALVKVSEPPLKVAELEGARPSSRGCFGYSSRKSKRSRKCPFACVKPVRLSAACG